MEGGKAVHKTAKLELEEYGLGITQICCLRGYPGPLFKRRPGP